MPKAKSMKTIAIVIAIQKYKKIFAHKIYFLLTSETKVFNVMCYYFWELKICIRVRRVTELINQKKLIIRYTHIHACTLTAGINSSGVNTLKSNAGKSG